MTTVKYEPDAWYPLSASQRGLWLQYQMHPESRGFFNINFCIRISGELDDSHLNKALNVLAARHSMLRARFQEINGTPSQCVDHNATIEVSVFDVNDFTDTQLEQRLTEDIAKPF
ncbi:MAG: condensation domain-containing protein, partial [Burkholderiaceae bacterium]|nr:condensation domain-containing protein [Burkholderiaceae bacterium]